MEYSTLAKAEHKAMPLKTLQLIGGKEIGA